MDKKSKQILEKEIKQLRRDILLMLFEAQSGHPGGSLSSIDIISYLFFNVMRFDPTNPQWPDRDRFILSKGHGAPALYAVLARVGYYSPKLLKTLRKLGSPLQGHPDSRKLPGVETSTGSLGQGFSIAGGMALAAKLNKKSYDVYTLLGDGEIQEGQVWETAMSSPHFKLDNFCAFIDNNNLQIDGAVQDVMNVHPIAPKFAAFNWNVKEIDGNDLDQIEEAVNFFHANKGSGKPTAIIAQTIKGKSISFMEGKASWHGVAPNRDELEKSLEELGYVEAIDEWYPEKD